MLLLETVKHITYNFGNLAEWLSAIGTLLAVLVSLYLSVKKPKPFLVIRSTYFPEEKKQKMPNGATLQGVEENITIQIQNESAYPVVIARKNHRKTIIPVQGTDVTGVYIAEQSAKNNFGIMRITNFDNLVFKRFVIFDTYSNRSYSFRFVKENNKWEIIYPLKIKSYVRVIRCILKQSNSKTAN